MNGILQFRQLQEQFWIKFHNVPQEAVSSYLYFCLHAVVAANFGTLPTGSFTFSLSAPSTPGIYLNDMNSNCVGLYTLGMTNTKTRTNCVNGNVSPITDELSSNVIAAMCVSGDSDNDGIEDCWDACPCTQSDNNNVLIISHFLTILKGCKLFWSRTWMWSSSCYSRPWIHWLQQHGYSTRAGTSFQWNFSEYLVISSQFSSL